MGIAAGLAWRGVANASVFYVDRGWSRGMQAARDAAEAAGTVVETRTLRRAPERATPHRRRAY
jgi:hypothetical protein